MVRSVLSAALVGTALMAAVPASAVPLDRATSGAFAQAQAHAYPGEGYSQYYGRRYGYGRGYYGRRGYGGGAAAAGIIGGLAVGALAGAAIANSQPAYGAPGGPGAPVGNVYGHDPNWVNYCASKFRSFDPASGTYLARDGNRYLCQ